MDEIEYKLKSQNPALISHAVSKLAETIKKRLEIEKDISKIPEFKLLSSKCSSDDFIVSTSACQTLIIFVKTRLCDVKSILATLMTCLSSTKNYKAITVALGQLLILDWEACDNHNGYTLQVPNQHPFIAILNQEKQSWRLVLNQMKLIMCYDDKRIIEQRIELLRPVFIHILCNPSMDLSDSCKQEAWQLVINSDKTLDLQMEILLWLRTNRESTCIDTNQRVLELTEVTLQRGDVEYCTALVPLIASLTIQLLEHGHEPEQNFSMICKLIEQCCYNDIGDITLILMAEIILACPATYLLNALKICTIIIDKMPCNVIILHALVASLLKWLAYPSLLCSDALMVAKGLINKIISRREITGGDGAVSNKVLLMFSHSNRYIQLYTELIHNLYYLENNTQSWLKNLSFSPIDLRYMCKLVLCGIFLYSDEPHIVQNTCQILVQITREINALASHILSLLLYKLTKFHDSSTLKDLLLAVPEFAMFKENLPIVIHTLDTLYNSSKQLKYFAIQLYTKALEKEPRCYRFMSVALMDTMEHDRSWYSVVACARAMKYVCESRPELSQELAPLLSQILNQCVDLNGGAATALALNSVSALCKSSTISVCSAWKIIAPKMRKEKRTVVLESLCEFFANVPSYSFQAGDNYEDLCTDIMTLLWSYVICENARVAESALKALKSYHIAQVPLSALPSNFRSNLVLPQAYQKKIDKGDNPEDVLEYVPGICWIQMLQKINKSVQSAAGDLLISYIEEELNTFRSRIYNWPRGEPQDFKYLPERSVIRAVGEYLRRGDKLNPSNQRVIVECLRIFNHKYAKPLPNIKWDFLQEAMLISEEAKEYGLSIASRHSCTSSSAKQLVEKVLSVYRNKSASDVGPLLLNEKHLVFYSNLCDVCQAIQSDDLKQFLGTSLDYVLDRILLNENDEKAIALFNHFMSPYAAALRCDAIYSENRTTLITMLMRIFNKVDLRSKHFEEYFTVVMELSIKEVERMTSLDSWGEISPKELRNVIAISAELAFRKFTDTPLAWLNKPIKMVASNPTAEMQNYLLENIQRVQTELRLEKHCMDWILDFMSSIDALMMEPSHEKDITLYYDILFISVISLSGMDCLLPKKESLVTSQNIRVRFFPQAISMLVDRQIWKSTTRQIMNWLNHMRTTSVPDVYRFAFQSSLILLRHEEDYNSQWTNYLSVRTNIHT